MGTNYYARIDCCNKCNRGDKIHIGKQSMGWSFSFYATDEIRSYRDWLRVLRRKNTEIYDEYGEEIPLKEFKEMVEATKLGKNSTDEVRKSSHNKYMKDKYFKDKEGYSFSEFEFC